MTEDFKNYTPPHSEINEGNNFVDGASFIDMGYYLPYSQDYFEVARVLLNSFLDDSYSIRVKIENAKYFIDVVDEYENEYVDYIKEYDHIPTQGEIFDVFKNMNTEYDSNYYWVQIFDQNDLSSIDQITNFITINSNYYPNLNEMLVSWLKQLNYPMK